MSDQLDLDALARLEQAATPAPWERGAFSSNGCGIYAQQGPIPVCPAFAHGISDGDFIATLRNAAPALITAIEARDATIALLSAQVEEGRNVLSAYEAWEADLIINGDWSGEFVRMNHAQHERMLEIQGMRNAVLAKLAAEGTSS